ncbi:MAG: hypothetical protein QM711_14225 [Micropruina sp.]|uniref:hypothetical protein n=1 Tax=Micropruina sp. TaxID=2737536 RepID=UPI0039E43D90
MVPVVLVSRRWLVWGPLLVVWQVGAAWAVDQWSSWEWLRAISAVLAWLVCLGVVLWGFGSAVIFSRRGFWVPFDGRGRWDEVVAREDLALTLRVGAKYGMDRVVHFDRVDDWPATQRILDERLPSDLPGIETTEPHEQWRQGLEEHADDLLRRIAREVTPPASERTWLRPEDRPFAVHQLQLSFEPVGGSTVEIRLGEEWFPQIRVDGCYAYAPELDEDDDDAVEAADDVMAEAAAILVSIFRGAHRTQLPAWRINDERGKTWDFYPRPPL